MRRPSGQLLDITIPLIELSETSVPINDGQGVSSGALAGLWGLWMASTIPRLRAASLATKPLQPFAHQDEAVADHMLPQPRLRFLLADEPGTGKTIMTGMYLLEARRRGLIPGSVLLVVPAHLIPKWGEELGDYFGIQTSPITRETALDPRDLDPRVECWLVSLDLFTHNHDVRRKIAGPAASWSAVVFDEAHRLTPTSSYLGAAMQLARSTHHLLLLTATPHRGREHYFRALCHLLDPEIYPWDHDVSVYTTRLRPSQLSFLRRMKEELRDLDGTPLFKDRFSETLSVRMTEPERRVYRLVMQYVEDWYGREAILALSIYGKRAASSLESVLLTLGRRLDVLRGHHRDPHEEVLPGELAAGLRGDRSLSDAFDDPSMGGRAEDWLTHAAPRDRNAELEVVAGLVAEIRKIISDAGTPSKWAELEKILERHAIAPGNDQLLVFTEFTDTARWLTSLFNSAGFTAETLEGHLSPDDRHTLQQRFLRRDYQVLVSTDAGGEGINLQSANVMIDWDIPWSLVRLEQRMGRLHRIGQSRDVFSYHLVSSETREGRVQQVVLANLEEAATSLGGRMFDLLDSTFERATGKSFDLATFLAEAQRNPEAASELPTAKALIAAAADLISGDIHLRSEVDHAAASERFRDDRIEAINPVIVDAFVDVMATAEGWEVAPGPVPSIRRLAGNLPQEVFASQPVLFAADVEAVRAGRRDGALGLRDVVVLGPAEPAFQALVDLAIRRGLLELSRGSSVVDEGSLTDYELFVFDSRIRLYDGVRERALRTPLLVRWSGSGAFEVSWESLLKLTITRTTESASRPTPGQLTDAEAEAREAQSRELVRQSDIRHSWIGRARTQLDDLEYSLIDEIASLEPEARRTRQLSFQTLKSERLRQLEAIGSIDVTPIEFRGWVQVRGGMKEGELRYDPNSEGVAIATVLKELEALDYAVDDRQTAGVGYDLLARHEVTGDQRCVEVKGIAEGIGPVWMEQEEWAQASQRRSDYWLYVVADCAAQPVVQVRVQDPVEVFGKGVRAVQRFQILASHLRKHVE